MKKKTSRQWKRIKFNTLTLYGLNKKVSFAYATLRVSTISSMKCRIGTQANVILRRIVVRTLV